GRLNRSGLLLTRLRRFARRARVLARAIRLRVDDDPALPPAARRAAPRPQWSLSFSHCSVRFQFGDEIFRNSDGPPQRAREGASIGGPLEARKPLVNGRSSTRRGPPPVPPKSPVR